MSPRLQFVLVTLLSASLFLLGLALGQWQLGRAAQKQGIMDGRAKAFDQPVVLNADLSAQPATPKLLYRKVRLQGSWLAEQTFYLDNRKMGGKVGLIVVTPIRLEGQDRVVLVQRGWIPRNFLDRTQLVAVPTTPGLVEIDGQITPWPSRLLDLGDSDAGPIRQNLEPSAFTGVQNWLSTDISVQQMGPAPDGLRRDWVLPGAGVDTHYGYAFQWFTLSALVAVYYLWFQIVKKYRRRKN